MSDRNARRSIADIQAEASRIHIQINIPFPPGHKDVAEWTAAQLGDDVTEIDGSKVHPMPGGWYISVVGTVDSDGQCFNQKGVRKP